MSVSSSTFDNYHTYEIDWQPEQITWSIDGTQLRQVKRTDTWNKTANRYDYPQTPARVQLSLWPAGLSTNGEGTISWAGGLIDWNSQDIQNAHYYYAMVKEIKVECYDPPAGVKKNGDKAYAYDSTAGTNGTVEITNKGTTLKSFEANGEDPNKGAPSAAASSGSSAAPSATNAPSVPGLSGAGTGSNGQRGGSGDSGSGSGSGTNGGSNGAAGTTTSTAAQATGSGPGGFSQGGNTNAGATWAVRGGESLPASMLAVLLAIAGLLVL